MAPHASSTYDPLDRLETITEGGATTSLLYIGSRTRNPIVVEHATDLSGVELYEFDAATGAPAYLARNAHGDVTALTDATGAVVGSATYDPAGYLAAS